MFFFTTTRPSLPKEGTAMNRLLSVLKGEGEKGTKKDMSIKDWFKGSCNKAGALNRSWTIEADRSAY